MKVFLDGVQEFIRLPQLKTGFHMTSIKKKLM